ncbi:hypothetical protein GURKE_04910 [Brevundimonas phage vB_BpoS-Gurke]|uniref:Uncharacterized protein n=1 Tax=Brevundimonas phage vB_BpoS-Gurke TaxID=2948599 RepID=A0A9E7N2E2_9CAUD|nr:hypothetical protein GURKE_04910 [Brevundimonas phage vB_BpoS-Gurke]
MTKPFPLPYGPDNSFSLASIMTQPINRDWTEGYPDKWDVVRPKPTLDDINQYAEDLWEDHPEERARYDDAASDGTEIAGEDLIEAFEQTDGYDEWRDSFDPMMNYAWPVDLRYTSSDELYDIAQRLNTWGLAIVLIERSDDPYEETTYEFALTGGGMDMSDHIAGAYLAAGQVPPLRILEGLSGCFPSGLVPRLPLDQALARAHQWLTHRADLMQTMTTRLLEHNIKAAAQG